MTKPTPGHRLTHWSFGVAVTCECGWRSCTHYGKGARGQAAGEWQQHIANHKRDALKADS